MLSMLKDLCLCGGQLVGICVPSLPVPWVDGIMDALLDECGCSSLVSAPSLAILKLSNSWIGSGRGMHVWWEGHVSVMGDAQLSCPACPFSRHD